MHDAAIDRSSNLETVVRTPPESAGEQIVAIAAAPRETT